MRRPMPSAAFACLLLAGLCSAAQQTVDRIVARVEGDILLLSEVRELAAYQHLVQNTSESDGKLLDRLIEQWIVNNEAEAARYPHPGPADVDRELARIEQRFASPQRYAQRLRELRLNASAIRRQLERQLFLSRYLDYKFRPAVQVEPSAIEKYYREEFLPKLAVQGQPAPALDAVRDTIRDFLLERGITEYAERWLGESRGRLRIEKVGP